MLKCAPFQSWLLLWAWGCSAGCTLLSPVCPNWQHICRALISWGDLLALNRLFWGRLRWRRVRCSSIPTTLAAQPLQLWHRLGSWILPVAAAWAL